MEAVSAWARLSGTERSPAASNEIFILILMSDFLVSLASVVEALLFASQKPLSKKEILAVLRGAAETYPEGPATAFARLKSEDLTRAMQELGNIYLESGRSFDLTETAAGWQLVTRPVFAPWLRQLFPESRPVRLSAPALETLAIIAYRQPLTRSEIEEVRGVAVDGVVQTLLDRGLVRIAGRAEVPGRPLLYETTHYFLEHFGLKSLNELPNSHELRRVASGEPGGRSEITSGMYPTETEVFADQTPGHISSEQKSSSVKVT